MTFVANYTNVSYNWVVNGGTILGGQGTQSIYARKDSYSMSVHCSISGTADCGGPTGTSSIYISNCYSGLAGIDVYPNPAADRLSVDLTGISVNNEYMQVELVDSFGEIVESEAAFGKKFDLDTSTIPDGVYFLKIKHDEGILTRRVLLRR